MTGGPRSWPGRSGTHMTQFPAVIEGLKREGLDGVVVFGGGIIPEDDIAELLTAGVKKVFAPGTRLQDIVSFIKDEVAQK